MRLHVAGSWSTNIRETWWCSGVRCSFESQWVDTGDSIWFILIWNIMFMDSSPSFDEQITHKVVMFREMLGKCKCNIDSLYLRMYQNHMLCHMWLMLTCWPLPVCQMSLPKHCCHWLRFCLVDNITSLLHISTIFIFSYLWFWCDYMKFGPIKNFQSFSLGEKRQLKKVGVEKSITWQLWHICSHWSRKRRDWICCTLQYI